jgi:hypothetical protein
MCQHFCFDSSRLEKGSDLFRLGELASPPPLIDLGVSQHFWFSAYFLRRMRRNPFAIVVVRISASRSFQ